MSNLLKVSNAASLALHTMAILARRPQESLTSREMAAALNASEAHLTKVLQRLHREGLVGAVRGPKGGFRLSRSRAEITLLEIYEAIDGPLGESACLLGKPVCNGQCLLNGLLPNLNKEVKKYLSETNLDDLCRKGGKANGDKKKNHRD